MLALAWFGDLILFPAPGANWDKHPEIRGAYTFGAADK